MGTIKGKIKKITEVQEKGTFRVRKLILDTGGDYPQSLSIDFTQNNCGLLDAWKVGSEVEVYYNLRGREWINPKEEVIYFTTVNGWRVKENTLEVSATDQSPDRDRDDMPF